MIRLALVALLLIPCPVFAEEAATTATRARTDAVRAGLSEPNPMQAISHEGDLTIKGLWAGTASFSAKPHTYLRKPVWRVVEKFFIDYKGVETHVTLRYKLDPDLTLKSGAADVVREGVKITTVFTASGQGLEAMRTTTKPGAKPTIENLTLDAADRATTGYPALVLFARAVPAQAKDAYALPWVPLYDIALGEPASFEPMTVTPLAQSKETPDMWGVSIGTGGALHLSKDRRTIRKIVHTAYEIVPKGFAGKREVLAEEKPATTWKQAFLKFGYGYHMAREPLLREAFHWPSMLEHESTVTKSWTGPADIDAFRKAWVAEFVRQSLRRPRADTERLLSMTLASGKVTEETADHVVFAAHKNFGGGTQRTYTLKRVDGVWYIAHVKF